MNLNIKVKTNDYFNDRISIETDLGAKANNVKIYSKGLLADLACWAHFAEKIKDSQGNDYIVNLRSLGKAWATQNQIPASDLTDKVKDEFAKQFFDRIETDHVTSEFVQELSVLFSQNQGGTTVLDLRQLRNLPNAKPYLNTLDERVRLYDRIRTALLIDFQGNDLVVNKVNECFPKSEGMDTKRFEELVKILNTIKLPDP